MFCKEEEEEMKQLIETAKFDARVKKANTLKIKSALQEVAARHSAKRHLPVAFETSLQCGKMY